MTRTDLECLEQFSRHGSQDDFATVVNRHVDLVYSAALRQVRSPDLAEEVCQSVFTALAESASNLKPNTVLSAWLYTVTRRKAIDVVRSEARRQAREQTAYQMSETYINPEADWAEIEPLLDEAMDALEPAERTAIVLRYFEKKSLREVGAALGTSEDTAQKRVSRAIERLREFLAARKVPVGTAGLVALVMANAVQAAPSGLAATLVSGALAGSISVPLALTVTKTIAMTSVQKIAVCTVAGLALVAGFYGAQQVSALRSQVQMLQQQQSQMSSDLREAQAERDRATNALAALVAENTTLKKGPNETLKLRGEVGRLRQENIAIGSSSALSKVTANPEARKMLRDQQKMAMSAVYKNLASRLKLSGEPLDKFNDLLADHIMANVDHVTAILHDKTPPDEMNRIFAAEEAALREEIQTLVGVEGLEQFNDYTSKLLGNITADQFRTMLTGDEPAKQEKVRQLRELIQEEAKAVLAAERLPADYQLIPMLNFRNIASEQEGERGVRLLGDVYQRVAARSSSFLAPEDIEKFQEFRTAGMNNNKMALKLNRTMMAPIAD